jgi:hypothetical protein
MTQRAACDVLSVNVEVPPDEIERFKKDWSALQRQRGPIQLLPEVKQTALLDAVDLSALLRRAIEEAGSQRAFARAAGVSPQYITQVLSREREPSQAVLDALGLRKIVRYRQVGSAKNG